MTTNTQQLAGLLQHVEGGSADLHPDDAAVDRFAEALKAKLARSRAKGRGGWDNAEVCSAEDLARILIKHLGKGNSGTFEDVATFAMMLHQRGADPAVLAEAIQARDAAAKREGWADMKRIAGREIEQLRTQLSTNLPSELRATIDVANDHFEVPVVGWSELEQPVAWAVFADNGNVICWSQGRNHASLKKLEDEGRKVVPLYAHPSTQPGQVPEGWKPVPIEPTEDLLEAIHRGGYIGDDEELRWFYKSILDAAPALGGE